MSAGHGKCVDVIHAIGDQLCQLGAHMPRPDLGPSKEETSEESPEPCETIEGISQGPESMLENIENIDLGEENDQEIRELSGDVRGG